MTLNDKSPDRLLPYFNIQFLILKQDLTVYSLFILGELQI